MYADFFFFINTIKRLQTAAVEDASNIWISQSTEPQLEATCVPADGYWPPVEKEVADVPLLVSDPRSILSQVPSSFFFGGGGLFCISGKSQGFVETLPSNPFTFWDKQTASHKVLAEFDGDWEVVFLLSWTVNMHTRSSHPGWSHSLLFDILEIRLLHLNVLWCLQGNPVFSSLSCLLSPGCDL